MSVCCLSVVAPLYAFLGNHQTSLPPFKDHKPNYQNNTKCKFLNPTKPELGKLSKFITDRINTVLRAKLKLNQLRNGEDLKTWFTKLPMKHKQKFIQLDIVAFYPSITEELFKEVIEWAKQHTEITEEEEEILFQSKKSFLFNKDEPWKKKTESYFDVTQGSLDGAETCELVGLYLLFKLQKLGLEVAVYRDDGLAACKFSPQKTENIKRKYVPYLKI